jgi:hypothetical protein
MLKLHDNYLIPPGMKTQTQSEDKLRLNVKYLSKPAVFILGCILFSFISCAKEHDVMPRLNTLQVSDSEIGTTTAKLKGEVLIVGNMNIIEYGIELSKSMLFTSPVNKGISDTPATGVFEVDFTGLEPNTLYYYKAYALINTANVYSQGYLHFTTKQ